jgi:hypothetical protein
MPKYSVSIPGQGTFQIESDHELSDDEWNDTLGKLGGQSLAQAPQPQAQPSLENTFGLVNKLLSVAPKKPQVQLEPQDSSLSEPWNTASNPVVRQQLFKQSDPSFNPQTWQGAIDQIPDAARQASELGRVSNEAIINALGEIGYGGNSPANSPDVTQSVPGQYGHAAMNFGLSAVNPFSIGGFLGGAVTDPVGTAQSIVTGARKSLSPWVPGYLPSDSPEDYASSVLNTLGLALGATHGIEGGLNQFESSTGAGLPEYLTNRGNLNNARLETAMRNTVDSGIPTRPSTYDLPIEAQTPYFQVTQGSPDLATPTPRITRTGALVRSGLDSGPVLLGDQPQTPTPSLVDPTAQPQTVNFLSQFQLQAGEPLVRHGGDLSWLETMQQEFGPAEGLKRYTADRLAMIQRGSFEPQPVAGGVQAEPLPGSTALGAPEPAPTDTQAILARLGLATPPSALAEPVVPSVITQGQTVLPASSADFVNPQTVSGNSSVDFAKSPTSETPVVANNAATDLAQPGNLTGSKPPIASTPVPPPGGPPPIVSSPSPLTPGPSPFEKATSMMDYVANSTLGQAAKQIQLTLNPESASPQAGIVARTLRQAMGASEYAKQGALSLLNGGRDTLKWMDDAGRADFTDRYEKGLPQATPELQQVAAALQEVNARNVAALQSRGLLANVIENYLPHLFKNPDQASKFFGEFTEKSLKPNSDFLKQRHYDFLADAVQAAKAKGLELVTDNPVEAMLLRTNQINDYVHLRQAFDNLRGQDVGIRYMRVGADVPPNMVPLADRAFSVFGPGEVTVKEAYDGPMRNALLQLAQNLGIDHESVMNIKGSPDALGASLRGKGQIQTTWGSPETVLTHELGHAIDDKFGMTQRLFRDPQGLGGVIRNELEKLADLRYEGLTPDQSYKDYVRTPREMVANLFHAYVHAPELAAKIAPEAVARLDRIIRRNKDLQPLADIQPSLRIDTETHTVQMPGLQVMGKYYAPPEVAAVLNNWAGKGLKDVQLFRAGMAVNRLYNQTNLAGGTIHGIGSMMRAQALDQALGLSQALSAGSDIGARIQGVGRVIQGTIPGVSAVKGIMQGDQLINAYLHGTTDPQAAMVIEGLKAAGGKVTPDNVYSENATKTLTDAIKAHNWPQAVKSVVPGILEAVSAPIMKGMVPRLKVAAFANQLLSDVQRTGAVPGTDEFAKIAAKSWDHVDDVLGQVVYDNLFAAKWAKDMAQLATRSASWTGGSLRTAATAIKDVPQIAKGELTYRAAYPIALTASTALVGGLLHKLMTGQNPQTLTDYAYPKTGRKNPDGTDERLSLPTDFKDYISYAHDAPGTLINKEGPLLNLTGNLARNQGYGGIEIRHGDDPAALQAVQVAHYLANALMPFSVSGLQKGLAEGKGVNLAPLAGLNPAPSYIDRSTAMNQAAAYEHDNRPPGSRTQAEADRSTARSAAMGMLQNKDYNGFEKFVQTKTQDGTLKPNDLDLILRRVASPALAEMVKTLKPDQAVHVFELATPEEKNLIWDAVSRKIGNYAKDDPQHADNLITRLGTAARSN